MSWIDFIALWVGYSVMALSGATAILQAASDLVAAWKKFHRRFSDKIWQALSGGK
jgi:hypothetical protein